MHEILIRALPPGSTHDVRFDKREIDVVAVPWNMPMPVADATPRGVHRYTEEHLPGSFDGIERRANRVKTLRDHDPAKLLGRAKAFYPKHRDGLLSTLGISRTPAGDDVLELAADGALDVSIGFAPMPDGEEWNRERSHVRRTRSFLGEVSFVTFGAFTGAETSGAGVLAVRNGGLVLATGDEDELQEHASATPNKDKIRLMLLERGYSPRST